jgi:hypothetical protein
VASFEGATVCHAQSTGLSENVHKRPMESDATGRQSAQRLPLIRAVPIHTLVVALFEKVDESQEHALGHLRPPLDPTIQHASGHVKEGS